MTRASRERLTGHIWVWIGVVSGLLALSGMLTYLSGGTRTPVPHVFYIPIVLAAGAFGLRGGLATAVVAGLVCGPVMPLDVDAGLPQPPSGWLIRLGFFVVVASVVGVGRNRLLELSQARQSFLNVVSHELRTPLASIVGFASLLTDQPDGLSRDESQEFAALILKEATELSNVVDHYVLEGRLSDSALFIDSQPTDLRRIIDIVLDGLPAHVRDQRVGVAGERVMCVADPLRLRQVLRSMLNNALAYTPSRIEVAVTAQEPYATVRIYDEQVTEKANLNPLTALTHMTNRAAATVSPPLGVGLAVSRDLVRRMGGDLLYEVNGTISYELRLPLHAK